MQIYTNTQIKKLTNFLILITLILSSIVNAQDRTYEIYFDEDNDSSTGCLVRHGSLDDINGIESKISLNTDAGQKPVITSSEYHKCNNDSFDQGIALSPSALGFNTGKTGEDVFEVKIPASQLSAQGSNARIYYGTSSASAHDILLSLNGNPINIKPLRAVLIPAIGFLSLLLLIVLVFLISNKKLKKPTAVIIIFIISPILWAMSIIIDGQTNDWENIHPVATDAQADADNIIDITQVFATSINNQIYFRMDIVDVELGNQIPTVTNKDVLVLEDNSINIQLSAADEDMDFLSFHIDTTTNHGTLGEIITIDESHVSISYQGNSNYNGDDGFSYHVNDGQTDSTIASVNINITAVNDQPSFTAKEQLNLSKGTLDYSQSWASEINAGAINENNQVLHFTISGNDNSALFNTQPQIDANGVLSFQLMPAMAGRATMSVQLHDDGGVENGGIDNSISHTLSINIDFINNPPSFVIGADQNILEDAVEQTISNWASDISAGAGEDSQNLTFIITQNSAAELFEIQPNIDVLTGDLNYKVKENANGNALITIVLKDNGGTDNGGIDTSGPQSFNINIQPVNDAPGFIAGGDISLDEDARSYSAQWASAINAGPDNESEQQLQFNLSHNNTSLFTTEPAINATGQLSFQLRANANGTSLLNVSISDDGGTDNNGTDTSAGVNFIITINANNDVPIAINQVLITNEEIPINITLSGQDIDGDEINYVIDNLPANGILTGTTPVITYIPNVNYHGEDSFNFIVNDGELNSNTATISITINPINDAPTASGQNLNIDEDTPINITLSGQDVDGDNLTYNIINTPVNGLITGNAPNLSYLPNENYHGNDSFSFSVNDAQVDSDNATINININPINDPPVITSTPIAIVSSCGENYQYQVTASDIDTGDTISYSLSNAPATMSIDANTGIINWSSANLQIANHNIGVVATDIAGASDNQSYNLQVIECNLGPVITSIPSLSVNEFETYNYAIQASDPNSNDILDYSITFSAHASTIDTGTGLLTSTLASIQPQGIDQRNFLCKKYVEKITSLEVVEQILWPLDSNEPLKNIDTVPLVLRLVDTNNDGNINTDDAAIIIFVAYGNASTALVAVRGDTGEVIFKTALNLLYRSSTLGAGDIDNDGILELIGVNIDRDGIIVFEHDGTIKYEASIHATATGSGWSYPPTIADLDGDGTPEILVAGSVLDAAGNTLWQTSQATNVWGAPIVADIDNDGDMEVITGGIVFDAITGAVIWDSPVSRNKRFFSAIANLDQDDEAELIFVSVGKIYAFEHTGVEIWRASLVGGGRGGAPTIGQVDGVTVIGVAGANTYDVYRSDGVLLWSQPIVDNSSSATGSSMFDFNGDDRVEIAYGDERNFRIYDGATGDILLQIPNISHTSTEYPVVADINGDQEAEILVVQNNRTVGLRAFSGVQPWVNTRSIWNQYGYNINNIDDNGHIPANPIKSWQTHNSYRLNTFPDKHPLGLIDLSLNNLVLNEENNSSSISIQVQNRGLIASDSTTEINIYNGNPNTNGILIASINVPILQAGEKQTLSAVNINPQVISTCSGQVLLETF